MLNSDERRIENKVLETYLKENPSTYYVEKDKSVLKKIESYSMRLYTHSLKLLPGIFKNANLLEFGTGTGERSLSFLKWGANCTFVEINKKAVDRATYLMNHFYPSSNYKLVNCSLFDYQSDEKFDITVSNAVLHHTPDKEKGFHKLVSYLKPGGVNVIGIGNTGACIQRNLKRLIVYSFAGKDEKKIERVAEDLFNEHIERAHKYGGRSRKAIIYDTYVNPKMDFISIHELMRWYKKYGLQHFSSWPPVEPTFLADGLPGNYDWNDYPEVLSISEWIWGTQIKDDKYLLEKLNEDVSNQTASFRHLAEALNDIQAENLNPDLAIECANEAKKYFSTETVNLKKIRNIEGFLEEIIQLLFYVKKNDYNKSRNLIKKSNLLFRGKGGIGLNYFAAIKGEHS